MKRILLIASMLGLAWPAYAQTPAAVPAPARLSAVEADDRATAFSEMLASAQRSVDGLSSDEMVKLLEAAHDLGQPQAVAGAVQSFLSRYAEIDPRILRLAARNAMLAGDYRRAILRYKQYLRNAPVNADSSKAAGELLQLLTDYVGQGEAPAANAEYGDVYRQSSRVKQYDGWFLDVCWQGRATGAMAKRLASIFAEKLPLGQERFAYWHQLDRLTDRLGSIYPGNADAILPGRAIVPLIREDARRAARLQFFIENIAFHENRIGKNAAALDLDFEPVVAAARAYLDIAPTERTLRDIMAAFIGGPDRFDGTIWSVLSQKKTEFLVSYGFSKLPEADQIAFLNWDWLGLPGVLASSEQWIALGVKHPKAFQKAGGTARLRWITQTSNAPVYKAQAQCLSGHAFAGASMINAMAAAGDANGSIQHLLTQSSWYMPFLDRSRSPNVEVLPDMVFNQIIPAWGNLNASAGGAEAQLAFTEGVLFSSVMTPFSPNSVRDALRNAWGYCSQDAARRERYIGLLGKLSWVLFVGETREKVFEPALIDFRGWALDIRRQFDGLAGRTDDASMKRRAELETVITQIVKIEGVFQQTVQMSPDPSQAPNPQCRELASAIKALQAGDASGYAAAAKNLYAAIREYEKNKSPFGEALLEFLMTPRDDKLNCIGQQIGFLADQLALSLADPAQRRGTVTCVRMIGTRNGWRYEWGRLIPRAEDGALREKVAEVFAKAIEARTAKDLWDGELFGWYVGVVQRESEQAKAVVSAIIDRDIFTKQTVRRGATSPTCSAMIMIRNEFPALFGKYPVESWFDDRMAAEIKRTGNVDESYWTDAYGSDRMKKVANAIAETLAADISYSFLGTAAAPAKYSREQFFSISRRALGAEPPVVAAYVAKLEAAYGKTRFDSVAAGALSIGVMPVDSPERRQAFFARLNEYVGRAKAMPYPLDMPPMPQVLGWKVSGKDSLGGAELTALVECFRHTRWGWMGLTGNEDRLMQLLHDGLMEGNRLGELLQLIPEMWRIAGSDNRRDTEQMLLGFATRLLDSGAAPASAIYCTAGIDIIGAQMPEDIRNSLTGLRSRAMAKVGRSLLVPRTDRRYPILSAQSMFSVGMLESAWKEYIQVPELAISEIKDLDLSFTIWLVERNTAQAQFKEATALVEALIQWIRTAPHGFELETRAQIYLAAADIAMANEDYKDAREQYEQLAAVPEFSTTLAAAHAELKIAEVDRLTRKFDAAVERLMRLDSHRDTAIKAEARYQLAMVRFDQEDHAGAREAVGRVFSVVPSHSLAALLEGKLNVIAKKLLEATEVKLGLISDQQVLIPGRPLRVGLEDRTLATVGKSLEVELRAWSDSGDEEFFSLHPFGDSKTRFRGEVSTALAPTRKGDGVLQVLGRDKAHYGFSERFRKTANVAVDDTFTVEVISDSELYASSGRLLTKQEQEERALEALIVARMQSEKQVIPTRPSDPAAKATPLREIRALNQVKPGNPVYLRVIDPDRSTTHHQDTITLRAAATSGDVVKRFLLRETDTHSGVFEGKLSTVWSPATAYASDTEEGRHANYVISSDMKLPAWIGLADKNRHKLFTVDLRDNVALGKLVLKADVPGRSLKRFAVQTSLNGRDYKTVAVWPGTMPSWDGALRLRLVRFPVAQASRQVLEDSKALSAYLDYGCLLPNDTVHIQPGKTAGELGPLIGAVEQKLGLAPKDRGGDMVLAHLQGMFYMSERRTRTFKLDTKGLAGGEKYLLLVDGKVAKAPVINPNLPRRPAGTVRPGAASQKDDPAALALAEDLRPSVTLSLGKGYHTVELFAVVKSTAQGAYELLWDVKEAPYAVRVPEKNLTAPGWPTGMAPPGFKPEEVKANKNNAEFEMNFRPGHDARLVRFSIFDFESDAPAVHKITLTTSDGKKVLPVAADVMELRENQILEVVPGDRIGLAYEDPSVINLERQKLEVFMDATFNNGTLAPYLVKTTAGTEDEESRSLFVPIVSYRPDVPLAVFVTDVDEDEDETTNTIKVVARTVAGQQVEMTAVETDANSGMFLGQFRPATSQSKSTAQGELVTGAEDDIELVYRDKENTDIGIPWNRVADLLVAPSDNHSEMRVFEYTTTVYRLTLTSNELAEGYILSPAAAAIAAARRAPAPAAGAGAENLSIHEDYSYELSALRPENPHVNQPSKLVPGAPLIVEVVNPSLSFPPFSESEVFVQIVTNGSQTVLGESAPFDPNLPGTIRYRFGLSQGPGGISLPAGYVGGAVGGGGEMQEPLVGTFYFTIPTLLGSVDQMDTSTEVVPAVDADGVPTDKALRAHIVDLSIECLTARGSGASIPREYKMPPLYLRPDYKIRVAFNTSTNAVDTNALAAVAAAASAASQAAASVVSNTAAAAAAAAAASKAVYAAASNSMPVWEVREIGLTGNAMFDVMDQKYQSPIEVLNVGDRLYLRVIDLMADRTMENDTTTVSVVVNDDVEGARQVKLIETFENTGVFKGNVRLVFEGSTNETSALDTIGVPYGAKVSLQYSTPDRGSVEHVVAVRKGGDGSVLGFTRRFQDDKMAVLTQFSIAEAYFVMAKKYRDGRDQARAKKMESQVMELDALANYSIQQARKTLEEAIRDYPLTDARVQADYLMASLAFESAEQSKDEDISKKYFIEAISRFNDLIADFPDSEYAPKSQFRKAFVLERMGKVDDACEEYVKLSYRYPDHELVAETISRLGQYFMIKGRELESAMKRETDPVDKERLRIKMVEFFRTSAEVFGRLSVRFPEHRLAARTRLLSGENWLRAQEPKKAIAVYESLIESKKSPPDAVAQAMYWCGEAYLRIGEPTGAYRMFKVLTWDYPESGWARYARARLLEDAIVAVEKKESEASKKEE